MRHVIRTPKGYPRIQAVVRLRELSPSPPGPWMEPAKWQVQMNKEQYLMVGSIFKRSVLNLVATEKVENDMRLLENQKGEQAWIAEKDYQRLIKKHQSFWT